MSVVERLENTVAENEGDVITLDDARALLALVRACRDGAHVLQAVHDTLNTSEGRRVEEILDALAAVVEGGA